MNVNPLTSISAKLFYLIAGLVILAVGLLSYRDTKLFRQILEEQNKMILMNTSYKAGDKIENVLKSWVYRIKISYKTIARAPDADQLEKIKGFLGENENYIMLQFYREDQRGKLIKIREGFTADVKANKFTGKRAAVVFKKISRQSNMWLKKQVAKRKNKSIYIQPLTLKVNLPIMTIAVGIKDQGSPKITSWMVLGVWMHPIMAALRDECAGSFKCLLLDKKSKLLVSADFNDMKTKRSLFDGLAILKNTTRHVSRHRYMGGYRDKYNVEWLGSSYRINKYGLNVLIQKDAKRAYFEVNKLVRETLLWGALFGLIAIFFSYFGSTSLTKNLKRVIFTTRKIAEGNFNVSLIPRSRDEVGILSVSVNAMANQIKRLMEYQVRKARMQKELETAQAVQNTLFPKEAHMAMQKNLKIIGFSKPATECGGDWWGHYNDINGAEYIFIGDAMGHGVPAALVTAMAYSCCATLARTMKRNADGIASPSAILERFNKVLYSAVEGKISMTLFILVIDYQNSKITFANAGHNIPILFPKDPEDKRIKKKVRKLLKISPITPISLQANGSILGINYDALFKEKSLPLILGDKFFLFTDGLIECTNQAGQAWGRSELIKRILSNIDKDSKDLFSTILKQSFMHFNNHPLADDLTVVVAEYVEEQTVVKPFMGEKEQQALSEQNAFLDGSNDSATILSAHQDSQNLTVMKEADLSSKADPQAQEKAEDGAEIVQFPSLNLDDSDRDADSRDITKVKGDVQFTMTEVTGNNALGPTLLTLDPSTDNPLLDIDLNGEVVAKASKNKKRAKANS